MREIIGEIPTPKAGAEYTYMFKVQPEKQKTIFGTAFLYALMLKKAKSKFKTNCLVEKSDDDQNHLIIYA